MFSEVNYASSLRNDLNPMLDPYKRESASPNAVLYVQNLLSYYSTHLNTLKTCINAQAEGCWTGTTHPASLVLMTPTAGGLILPNGVYVMDFEDNTNSEYGDAVYVDYNGPRGPNQIGEDILAVALIWGEQGTRRAGSVYCHSVVGLQAENDALCQKVLTR